MATPISLSALKPPIPGPCPARGSTITNGRRFKSISTPFRRDDANKPIIDRSLERAAVDDQFDLDNRAREARSRRDARGIDCRAGASRPRTARSAGRRRSNIRLRVGPYCISSQLDGRSEPHIGLRLQPSILQNVIACRQPNCARSTPIDQASQIAHSAAPFGRDGPERYSRSE